MDHGQQLVQEEVVEEVIDDGTTEMYEEMIEVEEGDEMLLEEVEEISVDDVEYEQVPGAGAYQYVVQSAAPQIQGTPATSAQHSRLPVRSSHFGTHYVQQSPQQERSLQSQHVYAIRGNQVFRVDRPPGMALAVRPMQVVQRGNENLPLRHSVFRVDRPPGMALAVRPMQVVQRGNENLPLRHSVFRVDRPPGMALAVRPMQVVQRGNENLPLRHSVFRVDRPPGMALAVRPMQVVQRGNENLPLRHSVFRVDRPPGMALAVRPMQVVQRGNENLPLRHSVFRVDRPPGMALAVRPMQVVQRGNENLPLRHSVFRVDRPPGMALAVRPMQVVQRGNENLPLRHSVFRVDRPPGMALAVRPMQVVQRGNENLPLRHSVFRVDRPPGMALAVRPMQVVQRGNENLPLRHSEMREQPVRTAYYPPVSSRMHASEPRVPIAFRTAEAAYQQNRLLTPFLAARMVHQKKRQSGIGMKKPCNCTKSMCLKLYCDCFANGEFCKDCNCKDCHNNLEYEAERSRAIKASLERNPNAFKPKIGVASRGRVDSERLHQKGCHCKKSNCLKNYCECYEAKVPCTERCKCSSCRNTENDRAAKLRGKFGVGAEVRQLSGPPPTEQRASSPFSDEESDTDSPEPSDPKTLPWFYMTDEVVEAATLCLVAQAEEVESTGDASEEQLERAVLEEFGRCLGQVIENASKTTAVMR
ncbi:Protein lin-54 [Toxocara canis]|uniref:Protein lin-54 n=1 Tax=Toxocara canis TaxID=6265 RepID=A0A0B2VJV6_TOXCA|nr:Protein lin-54 [Toxocara canis]